MFTCLTNKLIFIEHKETQLKRGCFTGAKSDSTGDRYISDITSASNQMWRMVTNWSDPEEQLWIVAGKVDISPYDYHMLSFNPSQHLCEILERSVYKFLSFGQKRVLWGATDHQIKKVLPSVQADIYAPIPRRRAWDITITFWDRQATWKHKASGQTCHRCGGLKTTQLWQEEKREHRSRGATLSPRGR